MPVNASSHSNAQKTVNTTDTYVVVFNDNTNSFGALDDQVTSFATDNNAQVLYKYDTINGVAIKLPDGNADKLKDLKNVKYVEKDITFNVSLCDATGIIGAPQVWDTGYTGKGVKVAIVDTGIDGNHPDLKGRVVGWKDFVGSKDTPYDDYGHGTHCAGIIGGNGAASNGKYKGVAPEVSYIGVKVLGKDGSGSMSTIMKGLDYAANSDAKVISMSLGSNEHSQAIDDLVTKAVGKGKIVVCAAGNSGPDEKTVGCPADTPSALTVGATDKSDNMASFSSRGPTKDGRMKPDICAPGKDIISCKAAGIMKDKAIDTYYIKMSGTSMACPMVSGSVALMVQAQPDLTASQAKDILERTAKHGKNYPNNNSGYGRINISSAINLIKSKISPAPVKKQPMPRPSFPTQPTQPADPQPAFPGYPDYPGYPYPYPAYPGYPCPYPGYQYPDDMPYPAYPALAK